MSELAATVHSAMDEDDRSQQSRGLSDSAWAIVSYLLGGMLVWGGAGWAIDRLLERETPLFWPVGLLVGIALSMVIIVVRFTRD